MSHWVKIKLQLNDEATLVKALTRMGFKAQVGKFTISQYGQSEAATIRVDEAVGFSKQADGSYAMVGDFYHARGQELKKFYGKNNDFQQQLNVAYGIEDAKQKLEDLGMGFEITENEEGVIGKDGMIRMMATSWS